METDFCNKNTVLSHKCKIQYVFLSVLLIHCRSHFFIDLLPTAYLQREKQAEKGYSDKMKNYAINDITSLDGLHVYLMVYLL